MARRRCTLKTILIGVVIFTITLHFLVVRTWFEAKRIPQTTTPSNIVVHHKRIAPRIHHDTYIPPKPPTVERDIALHWIDRWKATFGNFSFQKDTNTYFIRRENITCLLEGTNVSATFPAGGSTSKQCVCQKLWHGEHCSIPQIVMVSNADPKRFTLRQTPRKVVQSLLFLEEYAMLCTQVMYLYVYIGTLLAEQQSACGLLIHKHYFRLLIYCNYPRTSFRY